MISQIVKLVRVISSEVSPMQLSLGFALSMIVGLTPLWSLHNLLVVFFLLILRINIGAFMLGWAFFTGLAYLFDPWFHDLGLYVLNLPSLNALWTDMYNSPFWRITHFNNSIVMGSLLVSLALFIPMVILLNILIRQYRTNVVQYLNQQRWFKVVKSKLFAKAVSLAE
ncbi:MAG: TIGR03546 family protein [Gammaproteobacteria bacterium]|nr:MAG: TIGR03546 family protein [Gammaproteobacteria bacterium]